MIKREEEDSNRFISYSAENINYVLVAQDVPSRGNKNFDYTLSSANRASKEIGIETY